MNTKAGTSAAQSGVVLKLEEKKIRRCVISDFNHSQSVRFVNFLTEEGADRCRQPNFTQGETQLDVQAPFILQSVSAQSSRYKFLSSLFVLASCCTSTA